MSDGFQQVLRGDGEPPATAGRPVGGPTLSVALTARVGWIAARSGRSAYSLSRPATSVGAWVLACVLSSAVACGGATARPSSAAPDHAIDLTRPPEQRLDPLAGLTPCTEAEETEACGAKRRDQAHTARPKSPRAVPTEVWKVSLDGSEPSRGPEDALVTLVVFSDFECPFCRRMAATLDGALDAHPSELRVVWKDSPLPQHEHAEDAALVARFAFARGGDDAFWSMHDALFAAQSSLGTPTFQTLVEAAGLPWDDARESLRTRALALPIYRAVQLAGRLDVRVTPTTFVNGRKVEGVPAAAKLEGLITEELAKARAMIADGVAPRDLHATIIAAGRENAALSDL